MLQFSQRKPAVDAEPNSVVDDSHEGESDELSSLKTSQGLEEQDWENAY